MTEFDPKSITIATTTFYPDWQPSQRERSVTNVRGEMAIQFVREAVGAGYQIVVVDGGSSDEFKSHLAQMGVDVQPELERGLSASRRQSYMAASNLSGVQVICTTEPEKVFFVRDCLPQAAVPILNGSADIVVPKRDDTWLTIYPDYQVGFEIRGNHLWNGILRARNLLLQEAEDLDIHFGPKLFRNDPEVRELFTRRLRLVRGDRALDRILDPELWHGAVVFPIITALHERRRVTSIEVPYRHPREQMEAEIDSVELRRKRDIQYKNLMVLTIQYIRLLQESPSRSRLVRISEEAI